MAGEVRQLKEEKRVYEVHCRLSWQDASLTGRYEAL